jgi:tripartite-type tricarboxylate transporter receptor subunit TctC
MIMGKRMRSIFVKTAVYHVILIMLTLCIGIPTSAAFAQTDYPNKPIRLLVGFSPGGGTDIVARIVGHKLGEALGQQVVIDNRAGANQIIASELTANAKPDGYTLFMASAGFTINPAFHEKLPFDPIRDFSPITMVATAPNVLVIHPSLPARSVQDLIVLARTKPGQLIYGSGGVGTPSHLSGALFGALNKIRIEHVPYKGSGQALTAMLSGELQMSFPQLSGAIPHIKSGKLIALGVTTIRRSALMPELPTIADSGIAGYETSSWSGVMGPVGIPKQVVIKLSDVINRIMKDPDMSDKLSKQGAEVVGGSPEEFAATISTEIEQWKKLVVSERIKMK